MDHGIRITPTRLEYARMRSRGLVTVDLEGSWLAGRHAPSSKLPLHLAVYRPPSRGHGDRARPQPFRDAWSLLEEPLEPTIEDSSYFEMGLVRTVAHHPSGSEELAEAPAKLMGTSRAVLLARHGTVAVAGDVDRALLTAEAVEHHACVTLLARIASVR